MSQTRPDILSSSVQETDIWLKELRDDMRLEHPKQAYGALRAVLHALRDRLTVDQAAHLAAQLPTMTRGVFYEGYQPSATPTRIRTHRDFIADVRERLRGHDEVDPAFAIESVFMLLERHVSPGLIRKIVNQMPAELRVFWSTGPEPRAVSGVVGGQRRRPPARATGASRRAASPWPSGDRLALLLVAGALGAAALAGLAFMAAATPRHGIAFRSNRATGNEGGDRPERVARYPDSLVAPDR